jgi:hypothetical protein
MCVSEYTCRRRGCNGAKQGWDTGEAAERCEGLKIWRRRRADAAEQDGVSERTSDSDGDCHEQRQALPAKIPKLANLFGGSA